MGILVGHEPGGKFGVGLGGNHGLGAFADVAAPNAVEFKGGTGPKLFDDGESLFANIARGSNRFFKIFFLPRQRLEGFALRVAKLGHVIVKAGDGNAEILVVQFGKELGQDGERIGDGAAVDAGVQIAGRSSQFNLVVIESAQSVGDGGHALGEHGGIGNDQRVGFEFFLVFLYIIPKADAAHFFFALDQNFDVDGKFAVDLLQGFERF